MAIGRLEQHQQVQPVTFGPSGLPGWEVGAKGLPAVIFLQEWWGVTEIVKRQAELFASNGFRVLIPDLYKGKLGVTREEAHHLMGHLDFKAAVAEIGEAIEYLKATGAPKVGITGFCMGGALSVASASVLSGLECTAPCYGLPKTGLADGFPVDDIKIPILGISGELDKHTGFSDPATVRAFEARMKALGVDCRMEVYPTAVHGFLNQIIKGEGEAAVMRHQGQLSDEADVQAAWGALVAFFSKHLKA